MKNINRYISETQGFNQLLSRLREDFGMCAYSVNIPREQVANPT